MVDKIINPDNFEKIDLTFRIRNANLLALLVFGLSVLIYWLPYNLIWKIGWVGFGDMVDMFYAGDSSLISFAFVVLIIIVGAVIHELIHGIIFAKFCENGFRSIKFGIMFKSLTPYCHCRELLIKKHYVMGALMPAIILGFLPALVSIISGIPGLLVFGILFTIGATGDFLMIYLLRNENKDSLVQDHPDKPGCYVYHPIDKTGNTQTIFT